MLEIPYVIEKTGTTEKQFSIFSRLLKDRVVYMTGEINEMMSESVTAQLMYLDFANQEDITMYINSPGGIITEGFAILDVMNLIKSDIKTVVMGQASSMGSFLAVHGTKGKRFSMKNARYMFHQPSGGYGGQATDIQIHANEIIWIKDKLNKMLSEASNLSFLQVEKLTDRDNFVTPEACLEYGFVDEIIGE